MFVCLRGECHKRRRAMSWEAARDKRQILQQKKIWQSCNILSLDRDDWECEKTTLCDLGSFLFLAFFPSMSQAQRNENENIMKKRLNFSTEKVELEKNWRFVFYIQWIISVSVDSSLLILTSRMYLRNLTQLNIGSSFVNFINLLFWKQKF